MEANKVCSMYSLVYNYDKTSDLCGVAFLVDVPTVAIAKLVSVPRSQLANVTLIHRATPLNYNINGAGEVVETLSFRRFSSETAVILYEVVDHKDKVLRYCLMNTAGSTAFVTKEQLTLKLDKATKPLLQNAIFRNGAISRPQAEAGWLKVTLKPQRREKTTGVKPSSAKLTMDSIKSSTQIARPRNFTEEQEKELDRAKKAIGDVKFISNPELSPKQMRVLWISKQKGCMSEAFAKPCYSVDIMKFYADRLYTEQVVNSCKPMLNHPELDVDELSELYYCIILGVPYEDLIGKSADDIALERERRVNENATTTESDLIEKALFSMMKIKGML